LGVKVLSVVVVVVVGSLRHGVCGERWLRWMIAEENDV